MYDCPAWGRNKPQDEWIDSKNPVQKERDERFRGAIPMNERVHMYMLSHHLLTRQTATSDDKDLSVTSTPTLTQTADGKEDFDTNSL